MTGKTHLTVGIATALAITQPETIPGVVAALAAGGFGGVLPDIDTKWNDLNRRKVFDCIINCLFICALIAVDFLFGNGICQYVIDNWGIQVWCGLFLTAILLIFGIISPHRSFTHSIVGISLFGVALYYFCRPALIPFASGYVSHIVLDLLNKKGIQLLYPIKFRLCFHICTHDGTGNRIIYWISFLGDIIAGAVLVSSAFINSGYTFDLSLILTPVKPLDLNMFQVYLIAINIVSFIGFQYSWFTSYREVLAEKDKSVRVGLELETWLLNLTVFIGGGIGMLAALISRLAFPAGYNGNWWSICYASIIGWFTIYCYVCNPFNLTVGTINWISVKHLIPLMYIILINVLSFFVFFSVRKRHLSEYKPIHTLLWLCGALGGTIAAYPVVICANRHKTFNYAVFGFPIMLASQILAVAYMISTGII